MFFNSCHWKSFRGFRRLCIFLHWILSRTNRDFFSFQSHFLSIQQRSGGVCGGIGPARSDWCWPQLSAPGYIPTSIQHHFPFSRLNHILKPILTTSPPLSQLFPVVYGYDSLYVNPNYSKPNPDSAMVEISVLGTVSPPQETDVCISTSISWIQDRPP